jgi:hypothetical protein
MDTVKKVDLEKHARGFLSFDIMAIDHRLK